MKKAVLYTHGGEWTYTEPEYFSVRMKVNWKHAPKAFAHACNQYDTTSHGCPVGQFDCPFIGEGTPNKGCAEITEADWQKIMKIEDTVYRGK